MSLPLLHQAWSPNYSSRGGQRVRLIVAHDCEGSYGGSVGWFLQSQSQVSAHIVLSEDGTVATRMVGWANKAWHACFGGNERYITRQGAKTFADTSGTTQDVLTPDGFKPLAIRSFGIQKLKRVTLATATEVSHWRNDKVFWRAAGRNRKKTVRVTSDHVWPLENDTLTNALKEGDVVRAGFRQANSGTAQYRLGVRDGFVFGDGYLQSTEKKHMRFAAPMHGRDKERVGEFFDEISFWDSRAKREHTYRGTGLCNSERNLKELPPADGDPDYLAGFIEGWLAADGCSRGNSLYTLSSVNREALEFVCELAPTMGISICGPIQTYAKKGYAPGGSYYLLNVRKDPLPWLVVSIEDDSEEEVFCAVFPKDDDNKLFVLEGGLLTHNCNFNPFSEGIEAAGYASKGLAAPEWDALAAIVAFRLHANGIPLQIASAANDWTGYCQHVDLGAAGGGHHDITLDSATRAAFYQRVASAYNDPNAPTTWIGAPLPGIPVAPTGWAPSGTVRHDLAPPSLEWVQMRLNALGYANPPLTVDGLDGPDTQAAVRNFQTAKNLIVDGIAGPLTVAALQ